MELEVVIGHRESGRLAAGMAALKLENLQTVVGPEPLLDETELEVAAHVANVDAELYQALPALVSAHVHQFLPCL